MQQTIEKLDKLIDAAGDKDQVEQLASIKQDVVNLDTAKQKAETDYRALLKDYADVVKHSSYKAEGTQTNPVSTGQTQSFEDFAKDYEFKNSKSNK